MRLVNSLAAAAFAVGMASSAALAQQQEGLVNVNVSGTQVQVPIGIAAQVCGVSVDALVIDESNTVTDCELTQEDVAQNEAFQNFVNRGQGGGQGQGQGRANAPGQNR